MKSNPIYIGLHIHKCAGTSLQVHLTGCDSSNSWFWHTSPDVNYWQSNLDIEEKHVTSRQRVKVIWGHAVFDYFFNFFVDRPIYLFTFLRHPVKRLASWYRYEARCHEKFTGTSDELESFTHFAKRRSNHMCRFLLNRFSHLDDSGSNLLHKRAISVLEKFAFIGLQEDFQVGVSHLLQFMNLPKLPEGTKRNVDDGKIDLNFDAEVLAIANESDMKLFEYANKRYQQSPIPDRDRFINAVQYKISDENAYREFLQLRCSGITNRMKVQGEIDAYCYDNLRKLVFLLIRQCFAESDTEKRYFYQETLRNVIHQFNIDLTEKDILNIPNIRPIV